ncbi:MAG: flagellar hook-basal body complex protein FliE [Candidatus Bathyarchaeota archaeon]|nr:MAG: flagellar hook-basal body complex protein FliE [Candidatus Bathyarchaeota archaeon]
MKEKIVLGVAGMPGAGKAAIRSMIKEMGYAAVIMGNEIRKEARRRGLKPTPENLGMIMLKLREDKGPAVVAERCIPEVKKAKAEVIVVDGVRSLSEVELFKRCFPNFFLIAIHTSPKKRFKRLFRRRRSDDPKNWHTFIQRDSRELDVGLGSVIASADYIIVNDGTISQLRRKVSEVLKDVIKNE